jgi:hypothetical protein
MFWAISGIGPQKVFRLSLDLLWSLEVLVDWGHYNLEEQNISDFDPVFTPCVATLVIQLILLKSLSSGDFWYSHIPE